MAINYEKYTNISNEEYLIKTNDEGVQSWVPCNLANSDYQRYLKWLENPEAEETQPTL